MRRPIRSLQFVLLAAALCLGCGPTPPVVVPALRDQPSRGAVVFVPGITGSKLCDGEGRVLWGDFTRLVFPRDGGYRLALPINGAADRVRPCGPVLEIQVMQWHKDVYGGLLRLVEANGYTRGEITRARPEDNFFFFDYDWRRDNIEIAGELSRALQQIVKTRGDDRITLVCQSNSSYICRYLVKYGAASLDDAGKGLGHPPEGVNIDKLVLLGNSNGGAIRILRELDRGRRYFPLIGAKWFPETAFTFRSLFQDLPVSTSGLFVDEEAVPLPIDLFVASEWRDRGWSIFASDAMARAGAKPSLFGSIADRDEYLRSNLRTAALLHRLLRKDTGAKLPRLYSIQNRDFDTPSRAIVADGGLLFSTDKEVQRRPHLALATSTPGDYHASVESQEWLSPGERAAMGAPVIYTEGRHFEMITRPGTQQRLLEILALP